MVKMVGVVSRWVGSMNRELIVLVALRQGRSVSLHLLGIINQSSAHGCDSIVRNIGRGPLIFP